MPRPPGCRRIGHHPHWRHFKPYGPHGSHGLGPHHGPRGVVEITKEELEAVRLKNILDLDQNEAAKKMNTSQSTYQRILTKAYKKIAIALVRGKAIRII